MRRRTWRHPMRGPDSALALVTGPVVRIASGFGVFRVRLVTGRLGVAGLIGVALVGP